MLSAAKRLRSSNEFADAVRTGRRVGRGTLVVHLKTSTDAQPGSPSLPGFVASVPVGVTSPAEPSARFSGPRAGFVVSKAVGGAVVRNKVKRRLRHLVAERLDAYPPGTDLVVRALPAAAAAPYAQLAADLDAALAAAARPKKREHRSRDGAAVASGAGQPEAGA
ncbi:MAG: ribonuclease P protein component [Hamadaea sp.]|nr:ribonuclease P protein component [Hamadaea sp.]